MKKFGWLALAAAMGMVQGVSFAADKAETQEQVQQQSRAQKPEVVYGSQLMTVDERTEYRAKMRSLKTKEERDALRMEHHQQMQERARAQGKTLPDMPQARGACPAAGGGAGGCGGCGGMSGCKAGCPGGGCGAGCPGCAAGGCPGGCGGMHGAMHGAMHEKMHGTQGAPQAAPKVDAASGVHSH